MNVLIARNKALEINPPAGETHLTEGGSDWLWAVTAVYCLSFILFYALSFKPFSNEKIFHYLFTIGLLVGTIAYFAMASDLAWDVIPTQRNRDDALTYQIFFAKYINWVVTWPILIISLGLMSGISWATMVFNVALSWVWVIAYLCSAYTATSYKWGFYAFGTVTYLLLAYQTLFVGLKSATRFDLRRDYLILAGWLNLLWLLYPIAFGVSDGGNVISVTRSFIFYGILDILMLPVLSFATLFFARKWDYGRLNLHFTQYGRVAAGEGTFPEKRAEASGGVAA